MNIITILQSLKFQCIFAWFISTVLYKNKQIYKLYYNEAKYNSNIWSNFRPERAEETIVKIQKHDLKAYIRLFTTVM